MILTEKILFFYAKFFTWVVQETLFIILSLYNFDVNGKIQTYIILFYKNQ